MSQMPESVLLHKDEKYNTGDYSIAYRPLYIEAKENDGEDKRNNYVSYIPNYRIKELLNHACRWIATNSNIPVSDVTQFVERFKDAMIKESLADVDWETWEE